MTAGAYDAKAIVAGTTPPGGEPNQTNPAPVHPKGGEKGNVPAVLYLSPEVAKVLQMTKAGVSEDVVIAYIQRQPFIYPVSANELIELRDDGVPSGVLKAMVQHAPSGMAVAAQQMPPGYPPANTLSPLETPMTGPAPGPMLNLNDIYNSLAPYGQWQYMPGYGWWWQPSSEAAYNAAWMNSGWNPYGNSLSVEVDSSAFGGFGGGEFFPHHHHHPGGDDQGDMWQQTGWMGRNGSAAGATPWLARNGGSPYGVPGAVPASMGGNPFLPVGGQPASGVLPPFGVAGQPLTANSGQYPWLPVGGVPASGNLPPYLPVGSVPPSGNLRPYLPVGGQPVSPGLPAFGVAPSFPSEFGRQFPGFPALPQSPMLPAAPMLPGGPFPNNESSPFFNRYASLGPVPQYGWPSVAPAPSWPSAGLWPSVPPQVPYGGYHGGFRNFGGAFHGIRGGFHGMGGGFHGVAGGVHVGAAGGGGRR